jgi:hypothetical protein
MKYKGHKHEWNTIKVALSLYHSELCCASTIVRDRETFTLKINRIGICSRFALDGAFSNQPRCVISSIQQSLSNTNATKAPKIYYLH